MSIAQPDPPITVSENAAAQITKIMSKPGAGAYLRVAVNGGGCSGFQYEFGFADAPNDDDLLIERGDARVLIDEMSIEFLVGSEIDYTREIIGAAFKIHNPQAVAKCGCGTSFSI